MLFGTPSTAALGAVALSISLAAPAVAQIQVAPPQTTLPASGQGGATQAPSPPASTVPGMVTQTTTQPPAATQGSTQPKSIAVPITGVVTTGGSLTGTLGLTSFTVQNGQLVAAATLSGVLMSTAGAGTSVITNVLLPVTMGQTTCQAVNMTLGPVTVNVAGLAVNLGQLVFEPTALAGSTDALGSLLCGTSGAAGNPAGLASALNQILAAM